MEEIERFSDPWDGVGLRAWRHPKKSRLLRRLRRQHPRATLAERRGYYVLRDFFGEVVDRIGSLALEYAYQRLLVLDWSTRFRQLGFFTEEEIRSHARVYGPPQESLLGHFWYGLIRDESLGEIERLCFSRERRPRQEGKPRLLPQYGVLRTLGRGKAAACQFRTIQLSRLLLGAPLARWGACSFLMSLASSSRSSRHSGRSFRWWISFAEALVKSFS